MFSELFQMQMEIFGIWLQAILTQGWDLEIVQILRCIYGIFDTNLWLMGEELETKFSNSWV